MKNEILFNNNNPSLNKEGAKYKREREKKNRIESDANFIGFFGPNAYFIFETCIDKLIYKIVYVPGFGIDYPGENIYIAMIEALYGEIEKNGWGKNFPHIYPELDKKDELSIINEMLGFVKMMLKNPQIIFYIDMQYYAIEYENFQRLCKIQATFAIVSSATIDEQISYFPNKEIFFNSFENLILEED